MSALQDIARSELRAVTSKGATVGRVIALANQKGGVAKTTSTLNLAVAFAEEGHKVLAVDLDPQGNLTMSQGLNPDTIERSVYDVVAREAPTGESVPQPGHDRALDVRRPRPQAPDRADHPPWRDRSRSGVDRPRRCRAGAV